MCANTQTDRNATHVDCRLHTPTPFWTCSQTTNTNTSGAGIGTSASGIFHLAPPTSAGKDYVGNSPPHGTVCQRQNTFANLGAWVSVFPDLQRFEVDVPARYNVKIPYPCVRRYAIQMKSSFQESERPLLSRVLLQKPPASTCHYPLGSQTRWILICPPRT